jgi:hypothetical protein
VGQKPRVGPEAADVVEVSEESLDQAELGMEPVRCQDEKREESGESVRAHGLVD